MPNPTLVALTVIIESGRFHYLLGLLSNTAKYNFSEFKKPKLSDFGQSCSMCEALTGAPR